jgi:type 2 lantibiotic biosynthesis protein LanM
VNHEFFQNPDWCRAATLNERAGSLSLLEQKAFDADLAVRRMKRWREQAMSSGVSYFEQRLAENELSANDLLHCLGEPPEALQKRLGESPAWVAQLARAFSRPVLSGSQLIPQSIELGTRASFLSMIEPIIQDAIERVEEGARTTKASYPHAPFEPRSAAEVLFKGLPEQLLSILDGTMVLELHVARLEGLLSGDTTEERFQSFLDRMRRHDIALGLLLEYPVLARQLIVRANQWVECSLEFLRSLAADWDDLRAESFIKDDPGMLVEATGGAGDHHRNGRSVVIARFSSGLRMVHKPRALSVDVHFQDLLAWLNERVACHPFRILKILDRGDHGWVEFVAAHGCISTAEITRFYERLGGYLALLYALEATDFHCENLIAAGEHPVLPDLEALFHPSMEGGAGLRHAEALAGSAINNSVAKVGLLPQLSWADGESAGVDLSGIGSLPGRLSPRPMPQWENEGTDAMRQVRKRVEMPAGRNRPVLDGKPVDALDYVDATVSGFSSVYRCLLTHQDELLENDGIVSRFATDEVRVILRATYTYGSLLEESLHPDFLRDGLDRDRLFDRLWTAVDHFPQLARVIPAERRDLQNGDVPIFTTRPDSRHLWSSSGDLISGFSEQSGMDAVRCRLQQLSEHDCATQIWFIRASFAMLSKETEPVRRRAAQSINTANSAVRDRALDAAQHIGDRLAQLALRSDGEVSWIGLSFNDQNWSLFPAGLDLYDGLPGIAVFLAQLGMISGEDRFQGLAREALVSVRRAAAEPPVKAGIGAFSGVAGVVYTLTHLGALWNEPLLFAEAGQLVDRLPSFIERDRSLDIVGGAAGCIAVLAGLYACAPSEGVLTAAIQCGEHLIARALPQDYGAGWTSAAASNRPLTGFSHGAAGIAWSLLLLFNLTGDNRFRSAALAGVEYERSKFSASLGNWLDLRGPASRQAPGNQASVTAWCHGAPGIGLARLLSLPWLDGAQTSAEIDAAIQATLAGGFGGNHCLCHGDLGNLELLMEAGLRFGDSWLRGQVEGTAAMVLHSIERDGWLCGNPVEIESPGLMTGLAGIGYGLLRIAAPDRVPSVLALELPGGGRAVTRRLISGAMTSTSLPARSA